MEITRILILLGTGIICFTDAGKFNMFVNRASIYQHFLTNPISG